MSIKNTNTKPLKTIGIVVALHSLIYSVGYILGVGGFSETLLYQQVATLMRPELFGVILLITGLLLIYGYIQEKCYIISHISTLQSITWLFATFVYFLGGDWLVGVAIGLVWSILSGYIAYAFKQKRQALNKAIIDWYLSDEE